MSLHDPQIPATVITPCCEAEVKLTADAFLHRGRPRSGDDACVWNLRCPACDAPHKVALIAKLRYQREEHGTRYETRRVRWMTGPFWDPEVL